jgi:hypothetical protein
MDSSLIDIAAPYLSRVSERMVVCTEQGDSKECAKAGLIR